MTSDGTTRRGIRGIGCRITRGHAWDEDALSVGRERHTLGESFDTVSTAVCATSSTTPTSPGTSRPSMLSSIQAGTFIS
jgi:hypothetical protein